MDSKYSDPKPYYLGNPNVKKGGVKQKWTEEEITEYIKCSKDPIYFIENYVKILSLDEGMVPFILRDYQKDMISHFNEHRYTICLSSRQSGKCHGINTIVKLRNKKTGEIREITIGEFYDIQRMQNLRDNIPDDN